VCMCVDFSVKAQVASVYKELETSRAQVGALHEQVDWNETTISLEGVVVTSTFVAAVVSSYLPTPHQHAQPCNTNFAVLATHFRRWTP